MSAPHFICIGAQKAGTRSFYDMMRGHTEVWMPPIKELHFFDSPFKQHRTKTVLKVQKRLAKIYIRAALALKKPDQRDLDFLVRYSAMIVDRDDSIERYKQLFDPASGRITGDVTPAYAALPKEKVAYIAQRLDAAQIFFILREPISRLWSQARMEARRQDPKVVSDISTFRAFCSRDEVIARTLQSCGYKIWKTYFGNRLQVLFFDDLRGTPETFYRTVCQKLGISDDPSKTLHPLGYNRKQRPYSPMPVPFKLVAREFLVGEHDRLAELVGGHAVHWRDEQLQRRQI